MSMVESEILSRVISPEEPWSERKIAEAVLNMGFKTLDKKRMDDLSEKAREGILSADEQVEIESYERVGHLVSLLKSKARRSLATS